jgi:hypothetical protein
MAQSQRDGIPIQDALRDFTEACKDVDVIIGHNIQFDKNIITVEFQRNKMKNCLYHEGRPLNEFCTMKQTVELCKLPFVNKNNNIMSHYKWPTLTELHYHLFDAKPKGTHNAIADVMICLRCYVYLRHNYDIAFDRDVKIVFKTLYAAYCLGGGAPYDPRNTLGGGVPYDPPLGVNGGESEVNTETALPLPPLPMSPPPLRSKKSIKKVLVQPAPEQNVYGVPRVVVNTEPFYTQYGGGYRN